MGPRQGGEVGHVSLIDVALIVPVELLLCLVANMECEASPGSLRWARYMLFPASPEPPLPLSGFINPQSVPTG